MKPRHKLVALGIALIAPVAALAWYATAPRQDAVQRIDAGNAALVAAGRDIYAAQCASCHGASLEGQPDWQRRSPEGLLPAPPHDATGHTWHHPDAVLFELTKYGPAAMAGDGYVSAMPPYEGVLTDEQIAAVLAYIKSTWPGQIRARQAEVTERAPGLP